MKKALLIIVILLISLPVHAAVVSRNVQYKQGDTVLQGA
jgi:hypothetical protein